MPKQRAALALLAAPVCAGATAALSWIVLQRGGMPLDGTLAWLVTGLTQSGSAGVVPVVILLAMALWATDPDAARAPRRRDALAAVVLFAVALPAIGVLNEYVLKPAVAEARPSHRRLAAAGFIPDLDTFYDLDRKARRAFLRARLAEEPNAASQLGIHPVVLEHWVHESGWTFPSGHALNAFIVCTVILGGAIALPTRRRRTLAVVLLLWAVALGFSRTVLQLHRPLDVAVGAASGVVVGLLLLGPWWCWTRHGAARSVAARERAGYPENLLTSSARVDPERYSPP